MIAIDRLLHVATYYMQDDDMDDFDDDFLGNLSQQELRDKQVSLVRTTHTHTRTHHHHQHHHHRALIDMH